MPIEPLIIYLKPGCINGRRQQVLLQTAGIAVREKNLLTQSWTPEILRRFVGSLPPDQWLNRSAPALRDGLFDPSRLSEEELLLAMCEQPLLIRRPLMEYCGRRIMGFDWDELCQQFGWHYEQPEQDLESCPRREESNP